MQRILGEKLMSENNHMIRLEKPTDYWDVEYLVRESFWNVYRPGCTEHYILHCLRDEEDFIPELDFVMEKDGRIIGQIAFVKGWIQADDGREIPVLTLGPICISPELQGQGYGKVLLDYSLQKAIKIGEKAVFLEGDIGFYGRSGFARASEFGIRHSGVAENEETPFFLCKELAVGYLNDVTGEYEPSKGYFVDEREAAEFDERFPYKKKLKLPGQLV